jgi:Zn-dependent M28 family amino/carboxypeptidase
MHRFDIIRAGSIALIVALSPVTRSEAAEALPPSPIASADAKAGAFRHLEAFQEIASANGGTRASGTPGYDRSADYVAEKLKAAGYVVHFEDFEFPYFEDRTPPILAVEQAQSPEAAEGPVRTLTNSGSADVTAPLHAVKLELTETPAASTSGCDARDFDGFTRGAIALVRRGTCTFQVKAENAVAAGAAGVVVMNEGTAGRTDGFSGLLNKSVGVPVVGISYDRGRALERLLQAGTVTARLAVDAIAGKRSSRNVLTEPDSGAPLIVVGAHLDSVPEGPGINDNGSGSAAVLEAALVLADAFHRTPGNVQFAFWGAEERGLVGSRHHVGALTEEERRRIGVYINLDMVGSPNSARFVQRSPEATSELATDVRQKLLDEFKERSVPVEERAGGRTGTDDVAFFQKGIPTVGLHSGSGALKSQAQADLFGGAAGKPYDPCYHKACDTTANIDREALEENARALIRVLDAVVPRTRGAGDAKGGVPEPR